MQFPFERIANIAEKGVNACYQHFLLFPQCFHKPFSEGGGNKKFPFYGKAVVLSSTSFKLYCGGSVHIDASHNNFPKYSAVYLLASLMVSHLCFFATLNKERNSSYLQLNGTMEVLGFLYSKSTPIVQQKNQHVKRLRFSLNTNKYKYPKNCPLKIACSRP